MKKYVFKKKYKRFLISIFDFFGYIILGTLKILKKNRILNPEKILVIRLDQIGDMVQALPFIDRLKEKYNNAKIYILCAKQVEFLLSENQNIEKIFALENSWFYKEKKVNLKEIINIIKLIRKEKIDTGFDLRGDLRNIILMFLCNIKYKIGYGETGGGFLLDCEKKYNRNMHEIDKNLFLIDEKSPDEIKIDFKMSEKNSDEIKNFLKEKRVSDTTKKIIIHPFSRSRAKMWGFEKFNKLMNLTIEKEKNCVFFIIGSPEEKKFEHFFEWKDEIINCIGKFSIQSLIELIKVADIYIGCDSGPQYFSEYSGVKTCIIYGYSTLNKCWIPKVNKENFIGFSKPVNCGPCEFDECPKDKKHLCMEIITVEEVYNSIKRWI